MASQTHAVGVIFENKKGEILVLKRHPRDPEGETWGLVGGKVDTGELPKATAIREVKEEIGYTINEDKLRFIKTYHWNRDDINLLFEVFILSISSDEVVLNIDKNENTEHLWERPVQLYKRKDLMIGLYPILKDNYKV